MIGNSEGSIYGIYTWNWYFSSVIVSVTCGQYQIYITYTVIVNKLILEKQQQLILGKQHDGFRHCTCGPFSHIRNIGEVLFTGNSPAVVHIGHNLYSIDYAKLQSNDFIGTNIDIGFCVIRKTTEHNDNASYR